MFTAWSPSTSPPSRNSQRKSKSPSRSRKTSRSTSQATFAPIVASSPIPSPPNLAKLAPAQPSPSTTDLVPTIIPLPRQDGKEVAVLLSTRGQTPGKDGKTPPKEVLTPNAQKRKAAREAARLEAEKPKMPPPRLLVASIGNPAPYLNTLHSAGHLSLGTLASSLGGSSFAKSRAHGNGAVSNAYVDTASGESTQVTLWQSPSLMNISGVALAAAWKQHIRDHGVEESRLVVLHDELETALGKLRVRPGSQSPKGHNGLKSIREVMKGVDYLRIGIGIGRPLSREPNDVANWCLRKWTAAEREGLLKAGPSVEAEVRKLLDKGI